MDFSVPREDSSAKDIAKNLGLGVGLVYLIFVFLEPFDFNINKHNKYIVFLGFSFLYYVVLFILMNWIYPLLNDFFKIKKWYFYHFLLGYIFMIAFVAVAHDSFQNYLNGLTILNFGSLIKTFFHAILIGLIPTVILSYISYTKALNKKLKASTKDLTSTLKQHPQEGQLVISASNEKEMYQFEASSVIFIKSEDNYIDVNYFSQGVLKSELIRTTLKRAEQVVEHPFLRVHRSYIINLNFVTKIAGNAQGMQLELKSVDKKLPVSRSYVNKLKETLTS